MWWRSDDRLSQLRKFLLFTLGRSLAVRVGWIVVLLNDEMSSEVWFGWVCHIVCSFCKSCTTVAGSLCFLLVLTSWILWGESQKVFSWSLPRKHVLLHLREIWLYFSAHPQNCCSSVDQLALPFPNFPVLTGSLAGLLQQSQLCKPKCCWLLLTDWLTDWWLITPLGNRILQWYHCLMTNLENLWSNLRFFLFSHQCCPASERNTSMCVQSVQWVAERRSSGVDSDGGWALDERPNKKFILSLLIFSLSESFCM